MAVPAILSSFAAGELSPALWGRTDLARAHTGATTFRNGYVGYRGGYYSRAGTAFVGFSKQTGRSFPPRLIPFQFSINQGLALEFGNFYMRVISAGGFVTENPLTILNITRANPAVLTYGTGASAATPGNPISITASYAPGDHVTMAGGTFTTAAVLLVNTTALVSVAPNAPGTGYAPNDVILLAGGTQSSPAEVSVKTTQVVSATIANGGFLRDAVGNPVNGTGIVFGETGAGTRFQASVQFTAGALTAVNSITLAGSYTSNPVNPASEPVFLPGGFTGTSPRLNLSMGVLTIGLFAPGAFTANAAGGNFTQASTTGNGTGATFQSGLFGPNTLTVTTPGAYTAFPSNPVAQASTTGSGVGATFNLSGGSASAIKNGDWMFIVGVNGMLPVNGQTYVAQSVGAGSFALYDVYGNPIDSTGFPIYTSGGTAARIFTLATPYAEADLPWLKFTESADVMSLCCVNQQTGTEYPPQDLIRTSNTSWGFSPTVPGPSVTAPTTPAASASSAGSTFYAYQVTAVSPSDGSESVASAVAAVGSAVDIHATAGTITITWDAEPGVDIYNIYKAAPALSAIPVGALFGFAGQAYGTKFYDSNIVQDFAQVPPTHQNPFAPGQIIGAVVGTKGSGYTTVGFTINTGTGSGASLTGLLIGGALVAIIVLDPGQGYLPTDTVTVTGAGGTGATATLTIGPQTGTYPGTVGYYQERRAYGYTINNPDTYFMSQPGAFTNFDVRNPTIDTDAITGSPFAVEVNGIQFFITTPAGLLVMTGLSAWLLAGNGSFATNAQAISPESQAANPQAFTGSSPTVPPIKVNYDILYVTQKGSFYYSLPYQLYALSEPIDLTQNSTHLFTGYTVREHAWCEQPNKVLWSVRSDGALLSLTWLKAEQVSGWGRHDTNGLFQSVCAVTEPPVDALYLATQRFPGTNTAYMIERMDNRLWPTVESTWCVDCGLALGQPQPNATLSVSSATGLGSITGVTGLVGGQGYSIGTTATVVDTGPENNGKGPGSGAAPVLTIVAGVITAITFPGGQQGSGYYFPVIAINDPANTGSGAAAQLILNNTATFTASAPVFAPGNVGNVIRANGGIALVTQYTDSQHVNANILSPLTVLRSRTTGSQVPLPAAPGAWTMTAPVTTISGLNHLAGTTVTGLADGNVIPPITVPASGTIALPPLPPIYAVLGLTGYTSVTMGLGFQSRLQSMYLDSGEPTVQGQRKKVAAVTVRMETSRGMLAGSNMPDGSSQSPMQIAPPWYVGAGGLTTVPDNGPNFPLNPYNALATALRTGDIRVPIGGGWQTPGQVALQQDNPLPMQVLAIIPEVFPGDTPQTQAPKKQQQGR